MWQGLIAAATAGMCNAGVGVWAKGAERRQCRPAAFSFLFMVMAGVLSATAATRETAPWGHRGFWFLAMGMGALFYSALVVMILANRYGPPSIVWSLVNLSLVLPIGLSAILLGEPLVGMDGAIGLAFIAMLVCFGRGTASAGDSAPGHTGRFIAALAGVFLTNGLLMFGFKLKNSAWGDAGSGALTAIMFFSGAILTIPALLTHEQGMRFNRGELAFGLAAGLASGLANQFLLAAMDLPAVVAFPVVQGVALVGGVILVAAVYREKLNFPKLLGLGFGIAVIVLAVLRRA